MAAIEFRTLRDYASMYRLHAYCPHCRHEAWLNLMRIAQTVGWDAEVRTVHKGLQCSSFGEKGAEIRIVHDGRAAQALSPSSKRGQSGR